MMVGWRWDDRVWAEENGYSQWEQHSEEQGQERVIRKNQGMKTVVKHQSETSVKVGGGAHWLEKSKEISEFTYERLADSPNSFIW